MKNDIFDTVNERDKFSQTKVNTIGINSNDCGLHIKYNKKTGLLYFASYYDESCVGAGGAISIQHFIKMLGIPKDVILKAVEK